MVAQATRGEIVRGLPEVARRYAPWLVWAPLASAAFYVDVLAHHLRTLVHDINWNADVISPMLLATTLPSAPGHPAIHLGNEGSFTTIWFDSLSRSLSWHVQLWEVAPCALTVATVLLLAWVTRRLASCWAAMCTLVIAGAAGPEVMHTEIGQAVRVTTWFTMALLSAVLVVVATGRFRTRGLVVAGAAMAMVTGLNAASDGFLVLSGVLPMVGAAIAYTVRSPAPRPRTTVVWATSVAVAAAAVAAVTAVAMSQAGFMVGGGANVATPELIAHNLSLLVSGVTAVGTGSIFMLPVRIVNLGTALCAVASIAAVVVVAVAAVRTLRRPPDATPAGSGRFLVIAFWGLSSALVTAGFLLTDVPKDQTSTRYLVPLVYAVAAVVPLAATRSMTRRAIVAAGVSVVAFMGARGVQATAGAHSFGVIGGFDLPRLAAALEARGLTTGYAGYWYANPLTLHEAGRLAVYPIDQGANCVGSDPGTICPVGINTVSTWYTPHAVSRTFLVEDPLFVHSPPTATVGTPIEVFTVDAFTVLVYPHDIASRLAAARGS